MTSREEVLNLLHIDVVLREEVRRQVLAEDVLGLPAFVRALVEAQRRPLGGLCGLPAPAGHVRRDASDAESWPGGSGRRSGPAWHAPGRVFPLAPGARGLRCRTARHEQRRDRPPAILAHPPCRHGPRRR
jgi:hypothetical protein